MGIACFALKHGCLCSVENFSEFVKSKGGLS
jgi:hypothetical protein